MSKALARLQEIKQKALHVFEDNQKLLAKNKALEAELKALKLALEQQTSLSNELNNKIKIIKLAQNIGSPGSENADITELKRKINEYIKEIDHCITMLND
jgi:hypothetical protein